MRYGLLGTAQLKFHQTRRSAGGRTSLLQPGRRVEILTAVQRSFGVLVQFATALRLVGILSAQELPTANDSFEVEPPLLVPPDELEPAQAGIEPQAAPIALARLRKQLERAREGAGSAERLVKSGVLAKVEAEHWALRAKRLEAEVTNAELAGAKDLVAVQKKRLEKGEISKSELDEAVRVLAGASAAAERANASYQQAQLDAAAIDLRRQKQLLAVGSARKSDVARAEEKLALLRRGEQEQP